MPISRLLHQFYRDLVILRMWVLGVMTLFYLAVSWVLFYLTGETDLTSKLTDFVYFASTTASTVGYGDLSPKTDAGRLVAAVFFFPGAVAIFTVALAKLTGMVVEGIRKMADGRGNFANRSGATVIVGYHPEHTERMIAELQAGRDNDHTLIVLADQNELALPDGVLFVHGDRLDSVSALKRAAVEQAEKVLVYASSDAESFNICLAIREMNEEVHVAAFFDDRDTAGRAKRFANVETVVAMAPESLVRAAQDPGTSSILQALASSTDRSTIYAAQVTNQGMEVMEVARQLLENAVTLVAIKPVDADELAFAPFKPQLRDGALFYYIADRRLSDEELGKVGARNF